MHAADNNIGDDGAKAANAKTASDMAAADKAAAAKKAADEKAAAAAANKAASEKASGAAAPEAAEELRRRATALGFLQMLTSLNVAEDATLKMAVVWCDEKGATSVSDIVECDMVDDFVRHLGLKPIPDRRLRTMLQAPTAALASQIPEAEKVAAAEKAATEGMECSFWFVKADSLRRAAKPSLLMMQTLRTQEPHRLVQITIGFIEGINGAYKNILVVSHRWETPTDPDPTGVQALAVQAYLIDHPEIDAVWFDFSSMPQGRNKTLRESAEFKEMLPNINLLYLTCSVLILMDRSYMNRFWTQFEAYLSMRAITSDGLTNALDPKARVTIKTADDP